MALINDIIAQIQAMGIDIPDGSYMGIAGITPEQIASGLQSTYGLSGEDLPPGLFQGISQGALSAGLAKTYSPLVEAGGGTLKDKLIKTIESPAGRQAAGGFVKSGQYKKFKSQAVDVFGKGMTDVLAQSGEARLSSLQEIQDMANKWRESALSVQGLDGGTSYT